jgi:tellurite methyltransferase
MAPAPRDPGISDAGRWNERYARDTMTPFPAQPAEWLVEHRSLLEALPTGGRALDVACGDGRNARYLAELGFDVDAVDISDVLVERLTEAADRLSLSVSPRIVDLESEITFPAHEYAVIVNFNFLQRSLFGGLARALRPGGLLVFETFARPHVDELANDFRAEFMLGENELLEAFAGLHVCHYFEGVAERSGKPRGVAGLVARQRGSSPGRDIHDPESPHTPA